MIESACQYSHSPEKRSHVLSVLVGVGFGIGGSLVAGWALLYEWFKVFIIANSTQIATYGFGASAVIETKGWEYGSPGIYAWSYFGKGILALFPSYMFIVAFRHRSRKKLMISFCLLSIFLLVPMLIIWVSNLLIRVL
jgi:hypothetical protein